MVDNCKNGIESLSIGQSSDEIHCYSSEWESAWCGGNAVYWGWTLVGLYLCLLTDSASPNVITDPLFHPVPPVILLNLS